MEKLTNGSKIRPAISTKSLKEHFNLCGLISQCWYEEPTERPAVDTVKSLISRIYTETSQNILDNLLSR